MENELFKNIVAILGFNIVVLLLFKWFGIYRFNHYNTISLGSGSVVGQYSRLKKCWRVVTTFLGIFFSPGLLVLYLIFKIGNTKDGNYRKKFFLLYEKEIRIGDSVATQMF